MRDERTYIRVHDGMPDHPKIEALSDKAFRLLMERWCWCARHRTDGRVPMTVWAKAGSASARRELVRAGLVEEHVEHVEMHDYLEHQRSAAEITDLLDKKRRAGTLGNHKRWHVPLGRLDLECPHCIAVGIADGSHVRSSLDAEFGNESYISDANHRSTPQDSLSSDSSHLRLGETPGPGDTADIALESASHVRSHNVSQSDRKTSPEVEVDKDKDKRSRRKAGGYTAEFELWWQAYPQRDGSKGSKFEASKAWAKALTLVAVDVLMAATKRYTDSQRVREGYAKDATTWLNQRCWEEFATPGSGPALDEWLKGEWRSGRVRDIEERTGLRYPQPDLPMDLPQDGTERWLIERCREWIATNHDLIVERLSARSTA